MTTETRGHAAPGPGKADLMVTGGGDSLQTLSDILSVQPPRSAGEDDTPPVFSFRRKRAVDIDWGEVVGNDARSRSSSITAMRRYFEESWFPKEPAPVDVSELDWEKVTRERFISQIDAARDEFKTEAPAYVADFGDDGAPGARLVEQGLIFEHRVSGRRYLALTDDRETLGVGHFRGREDYVAAWDRILGFELVFASEEAAKNGVTGFEEIDLRPAVIERRAEAIAARRRVASLLVGSLEKLVEKTLGSSEESDLDRSEGFQSRLMRARLEYFDLQREMDKLTAFTAGLGYELELQTPTVKEGEPPLPGVYKVVSKTQRTYRWTTTHIRATIEYGFLGLWRSVRYQVYQRQHSRVQTETRNVVTGEDLLAKWQQTHRDSGEHNKQAEFFVFEETASGYITADGIELRSLMDRCRIDEQFRLNCVVILPIHDVSVSGRRALVKYHCFIRPMPGIVPSIMPSLSIAESLSYKTAWKGLEVGELVSTINLAPGERRTVTIRKHFERETVIERSTNSVFEVERTESTDLATEMESEFENEQSESTSVELSASVSYNGGLVSGEASARAGVDTSNRAFAKSLNKVARKASQSVSQRNRQEVSTGSTARTTVATSDETVAEVENINEGRTLNLMFHRLYNRYLGGLYIENLQLEVIPAVELIAGSGIFDVRRFDLGRFDEVIELLTDTPLPFDLGADERQALARTVMARIAAIFGGEYGKDEEVAAGRLGATNDSPTLSALVLPFTSRESMDRTAGSIEAQTQQMATDLEAAIAKLEQRKAVEQIPLLVGTPGLYLDAQVGIRPGTEPYSEKMRDAEVAHRNAEVFAKVSEGMLTRARATRVMPTALRSDAFVLTSLSYDRTSFKSLTLGFSGALPEGEWELLVDGSPVTTIDPCQAGNSEVTVPFDDPQPWFGAPELLLRVELHDRRSGRRVSFPLTDDAT